MISDSKLLKENFEETSDYLTMNSKQFSMYDVAYIEKESVQCHNKTKHLMVSPNCFKQSLMLLRTDKAKEIRKYYLSVEKVFKFYLKYQNKYQELLLQEEKNKIQIS